MTTKNSTQVLANAETLAQRYATQASRDEGVYGSVSFGTGAVCVHVCGVCCGPEASLGVVPLISASVGLCLGAFVRGIQDYRHVYSELRRVDQEITTFAPVALTEEKNLLLAVRSDLQKSLALKIAFIASTFFTAFGRLMQITGVFLGGSLASTLILGVMAYRCIYPSDAIAEKTAGLQNAIDNERAHLRMA